jgi:hypothetical protein
VKAVTFVWQKADVVDGDGVATRRMAMVPVHRHDNISKRQYTDGAEYTLTPIEDRSMASHNQFFAAMHEYYVNLPEKIAARWPSAEHFRKWCLVETGWCDEKEFDMASEKHAKALGTFIRTEDEYARIRVVGLKVIVRRAKSQSLAAMGKADFEASKRAVLELAQHFVGVAPGKMMKEAGRHA